jgi:thioredoxin reductase (NADPH)
MEQMQAQAEHVGTRFMDDMITSIDLSKRPFQAVGDSGDTYSGDTVIISTGATARWLGIESEQKFSGFGVSACATCDGFFFRNKEVVVVGGGNSAVEESIYLAGIASKVTLVHRRDSLRASKIMQERALANEKIDFAWNSAVEEVVGGDKLESITLRDTVTGESRSLPVTGLFVAIGHDPRSELIKGQVHLDEEGYVLVEGRSTRTNLEGVFACGDLVDHTYRQAITAAGSGCAAALDAERFLASLEAAAATHDAAQALV